MLTDDRLRSIDDYLSASDVFPGVGLKGGVCLLPLGPGQSRALPRHHSFQGLSLSRQPVARFLKRAWTCSSASTKGCRSSRRSLPSRVGKPHSLSLPESKRFDRLVSSRKPFGLETTFKGKVAKRAGDVLVYQNGGTGYVARSSISTGTRPHRQVEAFRGYAAPGPATKTPTRTGSSARHSSESRAPSLRRPISALARSTPRIRLKASCPTSPVG